MTSTLKRLKAQLHNLLCIDVDDGDSTKRKPDQSAAKSTVAAARDVDVAVQAFLIRSIDSFDLSSNSSVGLARKATRHLPLLPEQRFCVGFRRCAVRCA